MAKRRWRQPLHLELPNGQEELPPIAAAFLILFDHKAGYTIAWKHSIPGLELNESVEYKSLPSGLHNVREDLIYFLHDDTYTGVSAFINEPAEETDRNALMLAVGALMPSQGRLGKSWKHAEGLKELAKTLSQDPSNKKPLEEFWTAHHIRDEDGSHEEALITDSPSVDKTQRKQDQSSANGNPRRNRALSTASGLAGPGQSLTLHHPALSLPTFLDTFGPLIFPLYKAALLRRRILIVGQAPVEQACNFVYDISLLSGIPSSVSDLLPLEPLPARLQPLFSVGIHDMSALSYGGRSSTSITDSGYGWVACTTDDILAHKPDLYDTLITLPPSYTAQAKEKVWPRIELKKGSEIKATQRDLRRYRTLRRELHRFPSNRPQSPYINSRPTTSSGPPSPSVEEQPEEASYDTASDLDPDLLEPQSWSALAYNSFMWWASAGEKRTDIDEEEEYDAALLRPFEPYSGSSDGGSPEVPRSARKSPGRSPGMRDSITPGGFGYGVGGGWEMSLIAYFHRFTALILKTISKIIDDADANNDSDDEQEEEIAEGDEEDPLIPTSTTTTTSSPMNQTNGNKNTNPPFPFPPSPSETTPSAPPPLHTNPDDSNPSSSNNTITIHSEDMTQMGLDIWSESDREFVRELVSFYWGRKAEVRGGRIECCGVRVF